MPVLGRVAVTRRDTVSVLEGNTFVVSRPNGDVDAGPGEPHGLFHRDTRHLSRWLLTVDGKPLDALSTDDTKSFSATFFLVPGTGSEYTDSTLSLIRRRVVGDGFFEELTVLNHSGEPIRPEIALAVGADFADLFQVKDATIERPGKISSRVEDGTLLLGYERGGYIRETWVRPYGERVDLHQQRITFRPAIEPQGSWSTWIEVVTAVDGTPTGHEHTRYRPGEEPRPHAPSLARPARHPSLREVVGLAPTLETDWEPLKLTYARSIVDLAALRSSRSRTRSGHGRARRGGRERGLRGLRSRFPFTFQTIPAPCLHSDTGNHEQGEFAGLLLMGAAGIEPATSRV